jgi:hypothetical protein
MDNPPCLSHLNKKQALRVTARSSIPAPKPWTVAVAGFSNYFGAVGALATKNQI